MTAVCDIFNYSGCLHFARAEDFAQYFSLTLWANCAAVTNCLVSRWHWTRLVMRIYALSHDGHW